MKERNLIVDLSQSTDKEKAIYDLVSQLESYEFQVKEYERKIKEFKEELKKYDFESIMFKDKNDTLMLEIKQWTTTRKSLDKEKMFGLLKSKVPNIEEIYNMCEDSKQVKAIRFNTKRVKNDL